MNGENETGAAPRRVTAVAVPALVAAIGVIATLLLGGSLPGPAFYGLLTAGVLVAAGAGGAAVALLRADGR